VKASTNANAPDNDPSFVDLTPNLSSSPMQVNLLGQANNQCFLAMLGSKVELQAGNYQQIRILLAPDSQGPSIANNQCGSYANCVVTSDGAAHDLALSSEAQTGLKIPSGQIANGQFTVGAGQTEDLDIDFNTCASIVAEAGKYRLKPVLHAGEMSTTSTSINGTVVDSATGKPISAGPVVVAAEQKDSAGVDRIVMSTLADSSGNFVFCPLPAGTYDIVAVGSATLANGTVPGAAYSAGVVLSIQPGQTTGNIALVANTQESLLDGLVTTQNGATPPAGTVVDLQLAALQQLPGNGPTITVPQLPLTPGTGGIAATYSPDGTYATAAGGSCASNVDCVNYALYVPSVWPNVATYQASGGQFSQSTSTPVNYTVDAAAEIPSSGGQPDCSTSEMQVNTTVANAPLTAASGNAATIAFTGCQ
ncbi:MAG TPA: DUF4382 domain-containing protein, partial [Acidobacteriaceae bacterium]|nr:DUF4382 domain-containing protein [Acidobacteriaceae bacterium]